MSTPEGRLRWSFDRETGEEEGHGDALGQNFKKVPNAALVRESIQNSLDAHLDNWEPVRVVYSFGKINPSRFPNFFDLKDHFVGCMEYWSKYPKIVSAYKAKYDYLESQYADIPYLKVSDYNTKGMSYRNGDNDSSFFAFVRASKVSYKGVGTHGGTHGFGKAAYFQLSPINTVLVSTMTLQKEYFFEGKATLCTHSYNGEKKTSVGYYDDQNGAGPVTSIEDIPKRFRREEPGTDFYIMGFDPSRIEKAIDEIQREVLRSFFAAVHEDKLIVEINTTEGKVIRIDRETLPDMMEQLFPEVSDRSGQFRAMNPRPYYEALVANGQGKGFELIKGFIQPVRNLRMYVKFEKGASDRVILMRKPLMTVCLKRIPLSNVGFYGLLMCTDETGDEILSKLENSSHSQWTTDVYRDEITDEPVQEGVEALKAVEGFIEECRDKLNKNNGGDSLSVAGLEDLLYVPDSLIDDDDEKDFGSPTGDTLPEGNTPNTTTEGIQSDGLDNPQRINIGTIITERAGKIVDMESGDETVAIGNNDGNGGGNHIPGPGDHIIKTTLDEEIGKHYVPLNVPVRVFAQKEDGIVYHYVTIHSDRVVENGRIELVVCGEQSDMDMEIIESSLGVPTKNRIDNLYFSTNPTRIRIKFLDNMMHSVQTKVYYEK